MPWRQNTVMEVASPLVVLALRLRLTPLQGVALLGVALSPAFAVTALLASARL